MAKGVTMTNRALEARLQTAAKAARLRRLERARSYLQHRFNRLQLMGAYPETLATVRALCIAGFCVNQGGEVNPGAIEDRCQQFLRRQKKAMAALEQLGQRGIAAGVRSNKTARKRGV